MNTLLNNPELGRLGKSQIVQMLDTICRSIEPTETQYDDANERYKTIGEFLAEDNSPLARFRPVIYPQGSMRIRAAIRPIHGKEFDVDLVCEFKEMPSADPKLVKKLVWDRFQQSDRYRSMAVEKNRCVQLQYAGDFHMDIMPCVPGQPGWEKVGAVWVPDKKMNDWKPSNPTGYAAFVETSASRLPQQRLRVLNASKGEVRAKAADVQPLPPDQSFTKPALIRIIQVLKRHRDEHFRNDHDSAPISVIITTLATHSYSDVVGKMTFDSVYDLLLEVVAGMPKFILVNKETAAYTIPNPTHQKENFAEKWNSDPKLAKAFFDWHRKTVADMKALADQEAEGLDAFGTKLKNAFGEHPANEAVRAFSASIRDSTKAGKTGITSSGLVVTAASTIPAVAKTPPHNFHGG